MTSHLATVPEQPSIAELAQSVYDAVKAVRMDRDDLITLIVQHSRVRNTRAGSKYRRLSRNEVKAALAAVEEVAKRR